ncbi:MAG: hypothetical protein NTX50_08830 [Candidatus Sumerlaeota bacterium]|nr:hypothetical protein [Candidatus Sumerlaeota bacterium]
MSPKDLFVLTADADAQAVMDSVLNRPDSLGIRRITFDIDRHPGRDSGMVQTGSDLVRARKGFYNKALLIWDNHGSGWEKHYSPQESQLQIEKKLADVTWKSHSSAIVIVPELEEWLWHNNASISGYYGIAPLKLKLWIEEFALMRKKSATEAKLQTPKELFEYIIKRKTKNTISPRDFKHIAAKASLRDWRRSSSFDAIARTLAGWFPIR